MKKMLWLIIAILLTLPSCSIVETQETPVSFYYMRDKYEYGQNQTAFASETHDAGSENPDFESILEKYFLGPFKEGSRSPFPTGTKLISFNQENSVAHITLNSTITGLSSNEQTIACACIAKTVFSVTGAETVVIQSQNANATVTALLTIHKSDLATADTVTQDQTRSS